MDATQNATQNDNIMTDAELDKFSLLQLENIAAIDIESAKKSGAFQVRDQYDIARLEALEQVLYALGRKTTGAQSAAYAERAFHISLTLAAHR